MAQQTQGFGTLLGHLGGEQSFPIRAKEWKDRSVWRVFGKCREDANSCNFGRQNITSSHPNELSVKVQGQNNTVCDLTTSVWAFQRNWRFKPDLPGEPAHFPTLLAQTQEGKDMTYHVVLIQKLTDNFTRFDDFVHEVQLLLIIHRPFLVTNVTEFSEEAKRIFR